jgi:hypothetical protein
MLLERLRTPLGLGRVRDDLAMACASGTDAVIVSHDPPRVCRGRFGECGMRTITLELRLDRALPHFEPGALCTVSYSQREQACTFSARVEDFFPAERVGDRPVLVLGLPKEVAAERPKQAPWSGRLPSELRFRPFGLGFSLVLPLTLDAETWLRVESAHGVVLALHRHTREERARRAAGGAAPRAGLFARLVRGELASTAGAVVGGVVKGLTSGSGSPGRWWTRSASAGRGPRGGQTPGHRPSSPALAKPGPLVPAPQPAPTSPIRSAGAVLAAAAGSSGRGERTAPNGRGAPPRRNGVGRGVRFLP